nr:MAG TPA: hypothetical protein [Caudoviricetes sp.]
MLIPTRTCSVEVSQVPPCNPIHKSIRIACIAPVTSFCNSIRLPGYFPT